MGGQYESAFAWRKSSFSNGAGGACIEVGWRKSSFSNGSGGDCVEVGWRKSSFSNGSGGNCVEVADTADVVAVRDTKDRSGPVLVFGPGQWRAFVGGIKAGELGG